MERLVLQAAAEEQQAADLETDGVAGRARDNLDGGRVLRKYGLACDNLLATVMVTADGALVRASAEENTDLFWALRGGGGNLGVVTLFDLELHRAGPTIVGGVIYYPGAQAAQVLAGWRDVTADAPDELTTLVNLTVAQ